MFDSNNGSGFSSHFVCTIISVIGVGLVAMTLLSIISAQMQFAGWLNAHSGISTPNEATTDNVKDGGISVTGRSEVLGAPDMAIVGMTVQSTGVSSEEAQVACTKKQASVLAAIKGLNIPDDKVKTPGLRIYPRYDYTESGRINTGYEASYDISVEVEDLTLVGAIIASVTSAGVDSVNDPIYQFSDKQSIYKDALGQAVDDARAKAEILAKAAGRELGEVQSIQNADYESAIRPLHTNSVMRAEGAASDLSVAPEDVSVSASVNMVFAFK